VSEVASTFTRKASRLATGTFILALVAWAVAGADTHWGPRYVAWRELRVGDWQYGVRFLNVDPDFRTSFVGKPRTVLVEWFPDLRPGRTRPDACPARLEYEQFLHDQHEAEWIGNSPWLVIYDAAGVVKDITLAKGC
jgi:hypothetical protein